MKDERFTYPQLISLLHEFDAELSAAGYDGTLKLDTIGGFAILAHGMRSDDPTTGDIDCVAPDLDATESAALSRVCATHGISDHWLNNDTVLAFDSNDADGVTQDDIDTANAIMDAAYMPLNLNLDHIEMNVATIQTLARAKAIAVCDLGAGREGKDLDDFLDILDHEDVQNFSQAENRFPFLVEPEFDILPRIYNIAKSVTDLYERDESILNMKRTAVEEDFADISSDIDDMTFIDLTDGFYSSSFESNYEFM